MEKLTKDLDRLISKLKNAKNFRESLEGLISVYPFSEYEYIISYLLYNNILDIEDYYGLRKNYIERNMYLYIFEISAPRGLGDAWAFGHLKSLVPDFLSPDRKLDAKYSNDYDLWLDWVDVNHKHYGIRIEIKTSRAVDFEKPNEPLYTKALASDSKRPFDMNFQQIKPRCADVFLWIGIWRDRIRYWVLNSREIQKNKYFSKGQHRGNIGEGQLHLNRENISKFERYQVESIKLRDAIVAAYKRQKRIK